VRRESGLLRCGGGKADWALCAKGEENVSEEQRGHGERAGVSMGIDIQANTRAAAHFSSLSTPFSLMQLAMMMTEATPSPLLERSIFSVSLVPLSSSI